MRMISLAVAMIGAMCVIAPEAKAQYAPWCSIDSRLGAENCGFFSYGQCRAYISGIGGTCYRSPYYAGPPPRYSRPYRRNRYVY
jgi:hypothetical protein